MSFPAKPVLKYFNARGVIEPTRIMLAIKGVEYVDERFPIDIATFARPEFDAAKAEGVFAVNMDRAPILVVGDTVIGQSKTIDRYVAKTVGMMGANDLEAAQVDMVGEHVRDIKDSYQKEMAGKSGEEKTAAQVAFVEGKLPEWLAKLDKSLPGSAGVAVGNSISLADVYVYGLCAEYFDHKEEVAAAAAKFAQLSASIDAVKTAAAAWLASRPVTKI